MSANDIQHGGTHYKIGGEEHWDRVARLGLDYFQSQITKYVERCWKKNGVEDLKKARHFLDKYLELIEQGRIPQALKPAVVKAEPMSVHPAVQAFGSERNPDGWIGYTFEGSDAGGDLFRCAHCRESFRVPVHANPNRHHQCAVEPGAGYVNQD